MKPSLFDRLLLFFLCLNLVLAFWFLYRWYEYYDQMLIQVF